MSRHQIYFWFSTFDWLHIFFTGAPHHIFKSKVVKICMMSIKSELSISLHVCMLLGEGLMTLVAFCLILFTFIFVLYMKKKICFFFDAYSRRVICMAGIYQLTLSSVEHICSHLNTFVFVSFISHLSEIFRNVSFLSNFSWRENHFL